MSLVEQAIARMRNQSMAAKAKVVSAGSVQNSVVPISPPSEIAESARIVKRVSLDPAALRASGYLPEEAKDRQFADQYRRIKRPLIDRALTGVAPIGEPRVIMVTSALPGDGKTFTSLNLALSMALERDISVLLVDSDVAKRHITQITGLDREPGLLDALVNEGMDPESLVVQTNLRGLSILPAGRPVETTAELLSSNRMRQIVTDLCVGSPRRIILLDSPPLLITNEGRILIKLAAQIVLVARAGHTPRNALQEAISLFDTRQAGGLVLNQVGGAGSDGYYTYGSYGAYGASGNGNGPAIAAFGSGTENNEA
jgi:protein-tyrosine kinase